MNLVTFHSNARSDGDRGVEFGRANSLKISRTVDLYQHLFDRLAGEHVDLGGYGHIALDRIASVSPALAREVDGIAIGCRLPATSIAAINARTELLAHLGFAAHECSTVVQLNEGRIPLAVQTWDWYSEFRDLCFIWEIPQGDGCITRTLTEYGIVGKIGLNTCGIGVLFSILAHEADGFGGAPVHVLARTLLDEARSLSEALLRLAEARVSASSALTLVEVKGFDSAVVSAELNPVGVGYVFPNASGLLTRTNHFLSQPEDLRDIELREDPDSFQRLTTLRRRLAQQQRLVLPTVIAALESHQPEIGATCWHADEAPGQEWHFETLATVALDFSTHSIMASLGGPCRFDGE